MLFAGLSFGQSYVQFGTGNVESSLPFYTSWKYAYTSTIYTKDEVGGAKTITAIAFNNNFTDLTALGFDFDMRVVLYDSGSDHSGYSLGCGNFEYGEVEDYAVEVKAIETAPQVDFFGDVTSVFQEGVVHFSDNSRLAPTQWKWSFSPSSVQYVEGTTENSQNPAVKFLEATNYSVTLDATNAIGTASKTKANYIVVKNYSAPKNLTATSEGSHGFGSDTG